MPSRRQTPPATQARVVLQPLRPQKLEGSTPEKQSPEIKKKKSTEEEEKEPKQESQTAPETARLPDTRYRYQTSRRRQVRLKRRS
jgi:hypothetical protein